MISDTDLAYIRKRLKEAVRPLFFFDDDADGLSSFLQLYALVKEGKGVVVKGKPVLEARYARKVEEYCPDLVVILDKPLVEDEFFDKVRQDIIWLDHHPVPSNFRRAKYFNPRIQDSEDGRPTSFWCYLIVKNDVVDVLWKAMFGVVGDWHLLLEDECREKYPYLLPENIKSPEDALFKTDLGKLVKIINWNLKGSTSDVMKSVKVLTRINDPYDILDQKTSKGKLIFKKFEKLDSSYNDLISRVKPGKDKILYFCYDDSSIAISSELSNELLFLYPSKVIIVARSVGGDLRMSIRSKGINVAGIVEKAVQITGGHGGGHDNACGANIPEDRLEDFLSVFRDALKQ
ncbi:DHH family phosphoesterase [Candidatus Woesearchaeota archaeon]|nr:DHH family phosphoesterase [Candidatus Woesearchaeota archaeon]